MCSEHWNARDSHPGEEAGCMMREADEREYYFGTQRDRVRRLSRESGSMAFHCLAALLYHLDLVIGWPDEKNW